MPEIQNLSLLSVPTEATLLQAITISLLYYYNSNLPNLALQSIHDLVVTSLLNPSVGPSRAPTGTHGQIRGPTGMPRSDKGPHWDPMDRPGPSSGPHGQTRASPGPHGQTRASLGPHGQIRAPTGTPHRDQTIVLQGESKILTLSLSQIALPSGLLLAASAWATIPVTPQSSHMGLPQCHELIL